jgi:hypothetical protein
MDWPPEMADWWHEVGCPHREWSNEELQRALTSKKQMENERLSCMVGPDNKHVWAIRGLVNAIHPGFESLEQQANRLTKVT